MFYEFERPKIPQEVLDQCYSVVLCDNDMIKPHKMRKWARRHCQSYLWMEELDISDFSPEYDYSFTFYFIKEEDQLMFYLKYGT
jgi:hypothetical protein